jgi:tryptophan halogenase
MTDPAIRNIVIVGGGTAGWMAASALSRTLGRTVSIRLIESDEIGIIGVGEATVPHLKLFNNLLGINEADFVRKTFGSFKLGIQFVDWLRMGESYIHGFGSMGHEVGLMPFHQYWIKAMHKGMAKTNLGPYSVNSVAAVNNKFMAPGLDVPANSPLGSVAYAYHFDAGLYAKYLRNYAELLGVKRTEGKILGVELNPISGFVDAVKLESGERVEGELFIDCSGFRGLLIEQALKTGYDEYTQWLPCDRAMAVPCANVGEPTPYTRSTAREAGWQWRIPLQHRTGNGYVYCNEFLNDDEAASLLLSRLDGTPRAAPRPLRFIAGRRKECWKKNCVALGLASGFLEPLESTSIHLIQTALAKLLFLFPSSGFDQATIDKFNSMVRGEYEEIRDFLVLHYKATERTDTAFWRHCQAIKLPDTLKQRWEMYRQSANIVVAPGDLFKESSWFAVYTGQGVQPSHYHPFADIPAGDELQRRMELISGDVVKRVASFPTHDEYIRAHCAAAPMSEKAM